MNRIIVIIALAATYFVFAMLLNSVAPVILQSMLTFGVDKVATSMPARTCRSRSPPCSRPPTYHGSVIGAP